MFYNGFDGRILISFIGIIGRQYCAAFGKLLVNNVKLIVISFAFAVIALALMNASVYLSGALSFFQDYISYLFFIVFAAIFISMFHYSKTENFKIPLYLILVIFLVLTIILSSQADLSIVSMILYSLFVFIILFVVYQLSKLLHHAKRQYHVIIGEFMCLASILIFIFALTYNSTRAMDYTMFSPFLILTPTYQLIYVVIAIIVVLVIGVLINDTKGGNS